MLPFVCRRVLDKQSCASHGETADCFVSPGKRPYRGVRRHFLIPRSRCFIRSRERFLFLKTFIKIAFTGRIGSRKSVCNLVSGPERKLSSTTVSLFLQGSCHVETFLLCSEAFLSCLSLSVMLFPFLALSPCSLALSYSPLLCFSIIPAAPRCRVRSTLLL